MRAFIPSPLRYMQSISLLFVLILISCQSKSNPTEMEDQPVFSSQNTSEISSDAISFADISSIAISSSGKSSDAMSSANLSSLGVPFSSSSNSVISEEGNRNRRISILKSNNPGLFQDIVFQLQPDSSYRAEVVFEVDLSHTVLTYEYSGKVEFQGKTISSGVSVIDFPNESTILFDNIAVPYRVSRYYAIPSLSIQTMNSTAVTSDSEYVACSITIDGKNQYPDHSSPDALIRQRGNSSRIFYEKKPYRIKLGAKASLLGMKEDKDWILLANYRDPTHFMNAVAFDMARFMNLPYTNSNRFVELTLNGEYVGMYQLTEQIEQGPSRVDIDELTGVLLNLDLDDGPELAPTALDNFASTVYELPVCIKNPKNLAGAQIAEIQADFAELETLIQTASFNTLSSRLDIRSFIDFLILQELTRNVELVSPRSMYLYKGKDQIYRFGPVWDFDGGFSFNWASMTEGHDYFGSQTWLMGESNPSTHPITAYDKIPGFFVDLFANQDFVIQYRARWNELNPGILDYTFKALDYYQTHCERAIQKNSTRWPIGKNQASEMQRLKDWLTTRASNYTQVLNNY